MIAHIDDIGIHFSMALHWIPNISNAYQSSQIATAHHLDAYLVHVFWNRKLYYNIPRLILQYTSPSTYPTITIYTDPLSTCWRLLVVYLRKVSVYDK